MSVKMVKVFRLYVIGIRVKKQIFIKCTDMFQIRKGLKGLYVKIR